MDSDLWDRKLRTVDVAPQTDPTSLKSRLQQEYEVRLAKARDVYEQRIREVTEQARSFYSSVQSDEVINTMKQNAVSQQFVDFRVRELHEETQAKEREITISKLQGELIEVTGKLSKLDNEYKQLLKSLKDTEDVARKAQFRADSLERQLAEQHVDIQQIQLRAEDAVKRKEAEIAQKYEGISTGQNQLKRSNEQIAVLEQQLRTSTREIESLRIELDRERARVQSMEKENQSVGSRLTDCLEELREVSGRLQATQGDKISLKTENERLMEALTAMEQESQSLQEKFSQYGQQLQEAINEESRSKSQTIESLQRKHASKSKLFKRKIVEQKEIITDLSQELDHTKEMLEEIKKQYEKLMRSVQEDIKHVRDEWERKLRDTEQDNQRRESDLLSKHKSQLSSLEQHFQSLLDKRVSEMQVDTQTQVAKAKTYDMEMKGIFEERIKSIEKDYILIAKHEAVVRDMTSKLRSEHDTTLSKVKDQLETQLGQLSRDLKTLKEDFAKKTRDYDQANSQSQSLDRECTQLKDQLRKADSYISELNEKQRALVQHLEAASENLQKLKTVCEDEGKKRQSAESELKKLTIELRELQEDAQEHQRGMTRTQRDLQEKLQRCEEDAGRVNQERSELRDALGRLQTENKDYARECTDLRSKLEKMLSTRKEESQRYERELATHMDTRNRLLQVESKAKALSSELQDYERRCSELKMTVKREEEERTELQQKMFKYESMLSTTNTARSELQSRVEKARFSLSDTKIRIKKMVGNRLSLLRNDLIALRSHMETAVMLTKKDLGSDLQDLLYRLHDFTSFSRSKYEQKLRIAVEEVSKDWEMKVREVEEQLSAQNAAVAKDGQEALTQAERQIDAYKSSLAQLKKDQRTAIDEIDRLKRENLTLSQENAKFQTKLKQNSQAFDDLEKDIAQEAAKIKQESDLMIEKSRRELVRKYEGEVRNLTKALEDIKAGKAAEAQRFEVTLNAYREKQGEEGKTLRAEYEARVKGLVRELEEERLEGERTRTELDRLKREIDELQRDHTVTLKSFEQRMADVEFQANQQESRHIATQVEQSEEVERVSKRLRDTGKELATKTEQITNLQKDKERQKALIAELQKQVEEQSADLASLRTAKDSEIEYLKTLLNKTFTVPVGEIKRSNELHQETMELMERVRNPKKAPTDTR